ncbi:MAG: hypothetical protein ACRDV4_06950, partial [Acidimicrobiales bacterium]
EECKHFQSRTYATGEVVRFCELDLAPEAPWRCPADCQSYDRRLGGAGWVQGSLVEPPVEDEPVPGGPDVIGLLEQAEDIVDAVVPQTLSEVRSKEEHVQKRQSSGARRRWPWSRRG